MKTSLIGLDFIFFLAPPLGLGPISNSMRKVDLFRLISCNLNNELCRRNSTWAVDFFLVPTFFWVAVLIQLFIEPNQDLPLSLFIRVQVLILSWRHCLRFFLPFRPCWVTFRVPYCVLRHASISLKNCDLDGTLWSRCLGTSLVLLYSCLAYIALLSVGVESFESQRKYSSL